MKHHDCGEIAIPIQIRDRHGNVVAADGLKALHGKVYTQNPSHFVPFTKSQVKSEEGSDVVYIPEDELHTVESGVLAYFYRYKTEEGTMQTGTGMTDLYWKNIAGRDTSFLKILKKLEARIDVNREDMEAEIEGLQTELDNKADKEALEAFEELPTAEELKEALKAVDPKEGQIIYTTWDNTKLELRDSAAPLPWNANQVVTGILDNVISHEYYPQGYGIITIKGDTIPPCLLFNFDALKSVRVSGSFKVAKGHAISGNRNLRELILDEGIEKLGTTVNWGGSEKNMAEETGAFSDNSSLSEVLVPDSVWFIGYSAFANCPNLKSCRLPNNERFTEINEEVFINDSNLSTIHIPNTVTTIRSCAFEQCTGLTSLKFPDSVSVINAEAFSGCVNMEYVDLNKAARAKGYPFYNCNIRIGKLPAVPTIEIMPFGKCDIDTIIIPKEITLIEGARFECYPRKIDSSSTYFNIYRWPYPYKLEELVLRSETVVGGNHLEKWLEEEIHNSDGTNYNGYHPSQLKIYVPENLLEQYRKNNPKIKHLFRPLYGQDDTYVFRDELILKEGKGPGSLQMDGCTANGNNSVAIGESTDASGFNCVAEGLGTLASGYVSHAEGEFTKARGYCSHTEGYHTLTTSGCEHAEGQYNISINHDGDSNNWDPDNMPELTVHTVGNGRNESSRHNAHEIRQDGTHYIPDIYAPGAYYEKPMINLQKKLMEIELDFSVYIVNGFLCVVGKDVEKLIEYGYVPYLFRHCKRRNKSIQRVVKGWNAYWGGNHAKSGWERVVRVADDFVLGHRYLEFRETPFSEEWHDVPDTLMPFKTDDHGVDWYHWGSRGVSSMMERTTDEDTEYVGRMLRFRWGVAFGDKDLKGKITPERMVTPLREFSIVYSARSIGSYGLYFSR